MDKESTQCEDDPQYTFYVDRNGRSWRVEKLKRPGKSCYRLKCEDRGFFEMTRSAGNLVRRELLCHKCLNERYKAWGLKVVNSQVFE